MEDREYITEDQLIGEAVDQEQPEEQVEQPEQVEETNYQAAPQSNKEENFRRLREKAERAERERDQAMSLLRQQEQQRLYNEQLLNQQRNQPQEPTVDPDDYAQVNYVNRMIENKTRQMETRQQEQEQKFYAQMVETRVKTQYRDFDEVVSAENIAMLRELEPAYASSLAANPDLFMKAEGAYKLIKQLGIHKESTTQAIARDRVAQNSGKPRPASVASPLSQANNYDYVRMSEADMARERDELERAIRG
jgi:hypothetical protein